MRLIVSLEGEARGQVDLARQRARMRGAGQRGDLALAADEPAHDVVVGNNGLRDVEEILRGDGDVRALGLVHRHSIHNYGQMSSPIGQIFSTYFSEERTHTHIAWGRGVCQVPTVNAA